MSQPAPYPECPLSPCIKLLSGAWTLEIIYFLRQSPQRFGELRRALGKVSSKVLTARLRELEERQVITRKELPTNPPSVEYALSELGRELLPVIDSFAEVSATLQQKYSADMLDR
ncbi:MAG TPA: transcriptional regulator [Gammaproteobacteria bacterium]|nr:transcriptional regulator [Gammaproteobacteria bacterium]